MSIQLFKDYTPQFVNPLSFSEEKLPLIVFVDNRNSWFSWLIKDHTKGNYNHAMWMHAPNKVTSQDPGGCKEKDILEYKKKNTLMKFWSIQVTSEEKAKILKNLEDRRKKKTSYDFLGLFGQWFNFKCIQNPWKEFCSEQIALVLKESLNMKVPTRPSPSLLNDFFNSLPERFQVKGYWLSD